MATRRRKKVPKYKPYNLEESREYIAALSPDKHEKYLKTLICNAVRGHEQTEASVYAEAEQRGFAAHDVDKAIDELLDEGYVRSTIIDGKDFGFLPGLVETKKRPPLPYSPKWQKGTR